MKISNDERNCEQRKNEWSECKSRKENITNGMVSWLFCLVWLGSFFLSFFLSFSFVVVVGFLGFPFQFRGPRRRRVIYRPLGPAPPLSLARVSFGVSWTGCRGRDHLGVASTRAGYLRLSANSQQISRSFSLALLSFFLLLFPSSFFLLRISFDILVLSFSFFLSLSLSRSYDCKRQNGCPLWSTLI